MKYYPDDIVEIISARWRTLDDMEWNVRYYYERSSDPPPVIGQRFKVKRVSAISARRPEETLLFSEYPQLYAEVRAVKLHYRPFRNRLRAFWDNLSIR